MAVHESSVNFKNLITDLADMYPQDVAEVVVIELIANALDAKATRISIDYNPSTKVLVVTDNGNGMSASQFDQYHDFAAGLKTRGTGIGFAGVGAKISFNIADRVITETSGSKFSGGSNWRWEKKGKLVWEEIQTSNISGTGTRVEVHFRDDATPQYSSERALVDLLRRNYLPLLDSSFLDLYERLRIYSKDLQFVVNGHAIVSGDISRQVCREQIKQFVPRKAGKGIGFGIFGLATSDYPLGDDIAGILVCTHGKVVKSDLFNQSPGVFGPRVFGLVEIRDLIKYLTTSKTDFHRTRGRNREFEQLYDPIRQEFRAWLTQIGVQPDQGTHTDEAPRLERELRRIADNIPEISDFFGFRARTRVLQPAAGGAIEAEAHEGVDITFPEGEGTKRNGKGPLDIGDQPGQTLVEAQGTGSERANPVSRTGRRGPRVAFDSKPDRLELSWVEGNSVIINSGHASYHKAGASSSAKLHHNLFAIASAIQRFTIASSDQARPSPQDLTLVDRILAAWADR